MSDLGHDITEKELKRVEDLISGEYRQAAQELTAKMEKHYADFDRKDAEMKAKADSGVITKQDYKNWRVGQLAIGKRWESVRDSMTDTLVNADKVAADIIRGNSIKAYGENMNYGTYEVEHGSKINTGFSLYDESTVRNLLKDDPKIIPLPKVDIPKDELWNRQKLTSAVTQGILQGESMSGIAKRLSEVAAMDSRAAIRNARTYTTAAENKGRIDSYERANDLGIETKKKWIATLDDRTRAEHRHLDNMVVAYDEDFEVDGYSISYPGDPAAEPEMIYNCRCTLVAEIANYDYKDERNDEKLGDMDYEEWKHAKDEEAKELSFEDKLNEIQTVNFSLKPSENSNMIKVPLEIDEHPEAFKEVGLDGDYLEFLNKVNELPYEEKEIPLDNVVTLQTIVNKEGVLKSYGSQEPVDVVLIDGKYYLYNGNHRATAAVINGDETILAKVRIAEEPAAPAVEVPTIIFNRYTDDNEKAVRAMYADQVSKYSTDERNGIRRYVGDTKATKYEYEKINGFLRNGGKISKANEEAINGIDKAIENFEVKEPFTVRRGVNYDAFYSLIPGLNDNTSLDEMKEALVGSEFVDKGYLSASWNVWHGFSRDVYLEVDVPAGKGYGCMVGNLPRDDKVTECEFILKRNTHVEFYDVTIDKYERIILHSKIVED